MKHLFFIIIVFMPTLVFAQVKTSSKVFLSIEEKIHAVISDTIEEGDVFAKVIKTKSSCTTSVLIQYKKTYRHSCHLTFKVQDRNWSPVSRCERGCKINFFSHSHNPTGITANEHQVLSCLEDLGEGC